MWLIEIFIADDDSNNCQEAAYSNCEEDQTRLFDAEVVDCFEDVGECGEKGEEDGEVEGCVEREEGDDWFCY